MCCNISRSTGALSVCKKAPLTPDRPCKKAPLTPDALRKCQTALLKSHETFEVAHLSAINAFLEFINDGKVSELKLPALLELLLECHCHCPLLFKPSPFSALLVSHCWRDDLI